MDYLNADGVMQTGWIWSVDAWYYLDRMERCTKAGWMRAEIVISDSSGKMLKGQQTIDGQTYVFNSSGVLTGTAGSDKNGWAFENGHWFYYQNGAKQTGWRW